MKKTASSFTKLGRSIDTVEGPSQIVSVESISISELEYAIEGWLPDCDIR